MFTHSKRNGVERQVLFGFHEPRLEGSPPSPHHAIHWRHACMHACTHARTHACTDRRARANIETCNGTHSYMSDHAHVRTPPHTSIHICALVRTRAYTPQRMGFMRMPCTRKTPSFGQIQTNQHQHIVGGFGSYPNEYAFRSADLWSKANLAKLFVCVTYSYYCILGIIDLGSEAGWPNQCDSTFGCFIFEMARRPGSRCGC